jgi:hypothetical protein
MQIRVRLPSPSHRVRPLMQVRLAKRWTSVHMLCPHVHEEAIELLVASVFVSPGAARAPATASSGLHRWLRLIADHPWDEFPLVRLHIPRRCAQK